MDQSGFHDVLLVLAVDDALHDLVHSQYVAVLLEEGGKEEMRPLEEFVLLHSSRKGVGLRGRGSGMKGCLSKERVVNETRNRDD